MLLQWGHCPSSHAPKALQDERSWAHAPADAIAQPTIMHIFKNSDLCLRGHPRKKVHTALLSCTLSQISAHGAALYASSLTLSICSWMAASSSAMECRSCAAFFASSSFRLSSCSVALAPSRADSTFSFLCVCVCVHRQEQYNDFYPVLQWGVNGHTAARPNCTAARQGDAIWTTIAAHFSQASLSAFRSSAAFLACRASSALNLWDASSTRPWIVWIGHKMHAESTFQVPATCY